MKRELIATAAFGLEAVVRREVEALGYKVLRTEDGKVTYEADERGIVRSNLRLQRAWTRLDVLYEETEKLFKRVKATRDICELRNMINTAYLITRWAIERKECRGLHYTTDYPHK